MKLDDIWDEFCERLENTLPPSAFGAAAATLGIGFAGLTVWAITHTTDIKLVIGAGSMSIAMFIYCYKM